MLEKISDNNVFDNIVIENIDDKIIIGLAGNPNTGKSTLFNYLTGLKQHTGNWPGKTVSNAKGYFSYDKKDYILVDLPGTYSLFINSQEEEIARDFICFGNHKITIVLVDGTNLERNLNLVLQIMEATDNVIMCINLMDEAEKKGIKIDINKLKEILKIPVVPIVAREGVGVETLLETVNQIVNNKLEIRPNKTTYDKTIENSIMEMENILKGQLDRNFNLRWIALRLMDGDLNMKLQIKKLLPKSSNIDTLIQIDDIINKHNNLGERIVTTLYERAEAISDKVININQTNNSWDKKIDDILTNRLIGYPIMLLLLGIIFWITIIGSNYPSDLLSKFLFGIEPKLSQVFSILNPPDWLHGMLIFGVYRTLAWVISVMLPPMAIFFPLFTLLEDLGYLPRIAFNLDNFFRRAGTQGKQALTMSMGFGCNAAGVISTRIIDSPREKLIAIITNNFVPCNGRFPIIITMATLFMGRFFSGKYTSFIAAFYVLLMVVIGVLITIIASKLLSKTILKGVPSSFTLELPPYRKPQIRKVIIRSIFDRTLFVLSRAIMVAAPAGIITWLFTNMNLGGESLLSISANFLNPFAQLIGLDGFILMAFLLGFPANEIVLPILIMSYMSEGAILELDDLNTLQMLLLNNGWTFLTALNFMLFSLLHFPCGTTLLAIKNETNSIKWPLFTLMFTTSIAIFVTFLVNILFKLII
ncbi:ferrous iron transport protein B [Clostridium sp. Cult2]|uniref:ferrous iron transport protein B n=1 Tax=Clostridium sp. Cult2 TaxID=2079003 RepID=UPI001F02DD49|nr:ferrous iron transport protein B [Clostridium sp. Cult2]MCF6465321.1 ferrous iron transport protein B [Clostridium sp. Cult2]